MYSAMEQYARWCYYQRCRTNIYCNNYQPQEWERIAAENVKNGGSWLYFTVQLFMKRDIVHTILQLFRWNYSSQVWICLHDVTSCLGTLEVVEWGRYNRLITLSLQLDIDFWTLYLLMSTWCPLGYDGFPIHSTHSIIFTILTVKSTIVHFSVQYTI